MARKYKWNVGDKARVKDKERLLEEYSDKLDSEGSIVYGAGFVAEMWDRCGQVVTISSRAESDEGIIYGLAEEEKSDINTAFDWNGWMLEDIVPYKRYKKLRGLYGRNWK